MARPGLFKWECTTNCAFWIFTLAIPVQVVHFAEHTVQLNQHFLGDPEPKGFFGQFFDVVGVHVAFNVGIFAVLLLAWLQWRRDPTGWRATANGARWFAGLVLFQAYHASEHLLQGYQHWVLGAAPTGLIGRYLPNVVGHYQLNLTLTILMVVVFVKLQPRRLAMPDVHAGAVGWA